MPSAVAGFFNSLPGWVQAMVGIAIALGAIIVAWKGILPHFVHEVPVGHAGVGCWRNRPIRPESRLARMAEVGPGYYLVIPALIRYLNVDMRQQTSASVGFKVDLERPSITYNVDGLAIVWQVTDTYRFVTVSADPERFITERVREAARNVMSNRIDPLITQDDITTECQFNIPNLEQSGMELVSVMITSGSRDTRNMYLMNHSGEVVPYGAVAQER